MSNKKSLWEINETAADTIHSKIETLDWSDPKIYGNWLAQTAYYVSHSTRVLAAAAARFGVDQDDTHVQLVKHATAEKRHERIAISDLKALGMTMEDFPELTSTKSLYRNTYFLIEHTTPMTIFGYIAVLELLSLKSGPMVLKTAQKAFGKASSHYLTLHTEDDVEHIDAYKSFLESLNKSEKAAVEEAILGTADNYCRLVEDIQNFKAQSRKVA